jgi:hypothetical protein
MFKFEVEKTVTKNGKVYKLTSPEKEEQLRKSAPEPKFLVNEHGHLLQRNREKEMSSSFAQRPRECGTYGFTFTPVGYNDYTVKPKVLLDGVRPPLGNTCSQK